MDPNIAPLGWSLDSPTLVVGWARGHLRVAPSDAELAAALAAMVRQPERRGLDAVRRAAIRDLLRGHGYKPTGRGKPASEFLARAAERGELASINNIVDINNLLSLETGLPLSVFDLDRADSGSGLELRRGHPGETFVFNASGQSIDVGGLVCVARAGGSAIGNPVKDSMGTKVDGSTRRFLAVIYGSARVVDAAAMRALCDRFAALARRHAAAAGLDLGVLVQPRPAP